MDVLTFVVGGLAVMLVALSILDILSDRLAVPLPILASIAGLALGLVLLSTDLSTSSWAPDSYDLWFIDSLALTPQSAVLLFLPPLLLEVTLGVDVRKLKADVVVVAVMAVLAVVAATAFVGSALALTAGVPLLAALLLGATISTTDPAAVVAIFRRIGAPRRLLGVLEGESLLNDAAAIALFVLFLDLLGAGTEAGPSEAAGRFAYLFAMGGLAGVATGYLASRLMIWMRGKFLALASISLGTAYASYLVAELAMDASGVVAVVSAGLTLTVSGASRVTSEDWQAMRTVWMQLGYWSNGLIILIAAASAPELLAELEPIDLALVAVAAVAAFASRAAVLFGLLPLLDAIGISAPMTKPQKILIWWGGIRGSVTILLAASLATSSALPEGLGARLAAIGVAFVFLTLLLNGGTLALMTRILGLDRLGRSDRALRAELVLRTMREGIDHVDGLAAEHGLPLETVEPVRREYERRLAKFEEEHDTSSGNFGDRLRTGLVVLANQERRIVRRHYDAGTVGRIPMRQLQRVAETLADAATTHGREGYEAAARRQLDYSPIFRFAVLMQRFLRIDFLLARLLARRFRLLFEWEIVLRDLQGFLHWKIEGLVGADACGNLHDLLERRSKDVRRARTNLELQYPRYADGLRRAFVVRAALRWEASRYERFLHEAIIGPDLHRTLRADLDRRLAATYHSPPLDAGFARASLVDAVSLFSGLGADDRKRIARAVRVRSVLPGDVVLKRGERGSAMYLIASGALEMTDGQTSHTLGTGEFFGESSILHPMRRRKTKVVALGFCRLLVLNREDFRRLEQSDPGLRERIEAAALSPPITSERRPRL